MTFIRFAGCNLNCVWCDTAYARTSRTPPLCKPVRDIDPDLRWVCITGGEPLVQEDALASLILNLKKRRKKIEIETNGSIEPPMWAFITTKFDGEDIDMVDSWVVDIKLPSSGNIIDPEIIRSWIRQVCPKDQLKFVVGENRGDLDEAASWISYASTRTQAPIIISPVMPATKKWMAEVAEFCMAHNVRLSLQLHKIIWGNRRMR